MNDSCIISAVMLLQRMSELDGDALEMSPHCREVGCTYADICVLTSLPLRGILDAWFTLPGKSPFVVVDADHLMKSVCSMSSWNEDCIDDAQALGKWSRQ
jgi:hypothetical protein